MIRILILEDDHDLREGLTTIMNGTPGFKCIAAYEQAETAIPEFEHLLPDVALVDIHLPGMSGIEFIAWGKPLFPGVQFIVFTVFEDAENIFGALKAGATGYLLKNTPPVKILDAINEVYLGSSPMTGSIARKVIASFTPSASQEDVWKLLSRREQEILLQLSKGYRYKEIAENLFISIDTVRTHIRKIYEKLQVVSRTQAINKAFHRDE